MKKNEFEFSSLRRRMPPLQAAGLKSAPSPPEPNVVCPNGPKELCRGLFVCVRSFEFFL